MQVQARYLPLAVGRVTPILCGLHSSISSSNDIHYTRSLDSNVVIVWLRVNSLKFWHENTVSVQSQRRIFLSQSPLIAFHRAGKYELARCCLLLICSFRRWSTASAKPSDGKVQLLFASKATVDSCYKSWRSITTLLESELQTRNHRIAKSTWNEAKFEQSRQLL